MDNTSSPDYKALFLEEEAERRKAEEEQRRAVEEQRRAVEEQRQAVIEQRRAQQKQLEAEALNQLTTFDEYIRACHTLLSTPLRAEDRSRSTKGSIPAPTGKYCPTQLREWIDFSVHQAETYSAVRRFLQPDEGLAPRLFSPLIALEDLGRSLCRRPISSEKDLEGIERYGKHRHVAREELHLGQGLRFDSHANVLEDDGEDVMYTSRTNTSGRKMQPDQFCVHRVDDDKSTLLMTVEYKPPHKLSVETLCAGLRPMDFWDNVVNSETIPTDQADKLLYNATQLTGAALVQEYHVMMQEGLAYSCVSTGIALVFLYVPEEEPTALYYHLCVPNKDVRAENVDESFQQPVTAVARLLCLCLMSCRIAPRSNAWRSATMSTLHVWETDFDHARSGIPDSELGLIPSGSEYVPSSPLTSSVSGRGRRIARLRACCAPSSDVHLQDDSDSPDPDAETKPGSASIGQGRKRDHSQIAPSSSPPLIQTQHTESTNHSGRDHHGQSATLFCTTQQCLLGLQQGDPLDENCPNAAAHKRGQETDRHLISAPDLVCLLKKQLDLDLDHDCDPFARCGSYGAPFKIRCTSYGYTIVGKGTTSRLWGIVSREAAAYRTLRKVQGLLIPVFLGSIDLEHIYFLHGAGKIQHMLLMSWGGEPLSQEQWQRMSSDIRLSAKEIMRKGVWHKDLRRDNVLWNAEMKRVFIIDFHNSELLHNRANVLKRKSVENTAQTSKRCRLMTTI